MLNFVDGLWSSCVKERLMIFTMNHPEWLNPALLPLGQMDRSIHLTYCSPAAFRLLARNYLEVVHGHGLMAEAEVLLEEVKMTSVEVAEVFMGYDGDEADAAMQKVVEELRRRRADAPLRAAPVSRWGASAPLRAAPVSPKAAPVPGRNRGGVRRYRKEWGAVSCEQSMGEGGM